MTLTTLFIILAITGVVFVAYGLMLDVELWHEFVIPSVGTFAGFSGGAGFIAVNQTDNNLLILAIAGVSGLLGSFLVIQLLKALKKSEHSGRVIDFSELVGQEAEVVWWDKTTGEVLVSYSGQREKVNAESRRTIKAGSSLLIDEIFTTGDKLEKVRVTPLAK